MAKRQFIDKDQLKRLESEAKSSYTAADQASGGALGILVYALKMFGKDEGGAAAAAIAYYTLFSLFPLLLVLISIGSTVFKNEQFNQEVLKYTSQAFPDFQELVQQNIQRVIELRETVSIIAAIGLLWAATSVFSLLGHHINLPWHSAPPRNFLGRRIVGLMMVGGIAGLILISLLLTTLLNLLPVIDFGEQVWGNVPLYETVSWRFSTTVIPWSLTILIFTLLYRWVPNTDVRWLEALWGATVATIAWEITKSGFSWLFIRSGLIQYQLIYGSLGIVIAFMIWTYLSSAIILFGAYLSASVAYHQRVKKKEEDY